MERRAGGEGKEEFWLRPVCLGAICGSAFGLQSLGSVFSVQQEEKAEEVRKKSDECREPEA